MSAKVYFLLSFNIKFTPVVNPFGFHPFIWLGHSRPEHENLVIFLGHSIDQLRMRIPAVYIDVKHQKKFRSSSV